MQKAQPPKEVMPAFDDVAAAREDRENFINKAQAYANEILPRAKGQVQRILEEAKAYKEQVVAVAEGETSRFLNILKEYQDAPNVTRERLYLETMEEIMSKNNKVMIDIKKGNNLMYLPLQQLMQQSGMNSEESSQSGSAPTSSPLGDGSFGLDRMRERDRSREVRQ